GDRGRSRLARGDRRRLTVAESTREKLRAAAFRQWSDPEARERILAGQRARRLVTSNLPLATWAASRYLWSRLDFDDLRQAALLGLHKAAGKYDPERGGRLSTVAAWYMFSAIKAEIAATRSTIRVQSHRPAPSVGSLDAEERSLLPSDDEDGPEVGAERAAPRARRSDPR
ncbi:MAG: sigma-70 family RNA polymerase sigma factor, partial [Planctomycetota bacterium]